METTDIASFAAQIENRIKRINWVVLKISPQQDGQMKYWILVDNKVMVVKSISSLRKIYVNSYEGTGEEDRGCQKKLPREKQSFHLFEYHIQDSDFQITMNEMNYYLTNPKIEGVYETQVDPDFRAVVQTGNICRISPKFQKELQ